MKIKAKIVTAEQYDKLFTNVSHNYNSVGSVLDMLAIEWFLDVYDILVETRYYRQRVKHALNECKKIADNYERCNREAFGSRFPLWVDYVNVMQNQLKKHVFVVYNAIHRFLSTRNMRDLNLAVKVLTAQVLLVKASDFHCDYFAEVYKTTGIDRFRKHYMFADLTGMAAKMQTVSHAVVGLDNNEIDKFNVDEAICLSLTAIYNYLNSDDHLNDAAKTAFSMNMDKYGEAVKELEEKEKTGVSQPPAKPKKTIHGGDKAAIKERLSTKFKVTSLP